MRYGSEFKIIDTKSSVNKDLSKATLNELKTIRSTKNQKKLYAALEGGTIEQIAARFGDDWVLIAEKWIDEPVRSSIILVTYLTKKPAML